MGGVAKAPPIGDSEMNKVDRIINDIHAGKYTTAFPTLKSRFKGFMVFSENYIKDLDWHASLRLDCFLGIFIICDVRVQGYNIKMTRNEEKRMIKALTRAFENETKAYNEKLERLKK